jgi:Cof subfamily protein (haloacid dehalogenase superfamily)
MNTYELIALDMDGTLLNDEKLISQNTTLAIEKAVKQGKQVVLSTGRAPDELTDYQENLKDIRYYICESGAMIYDCEKEEILHTDSIPENLVKQIMNIAAPEDAMVYFFSEGKGFSEADKITDLAHYHMGQYQKLLTRCVFAVPDISDFYAKNLCNIEKLNIFSASTEIREKLYNILKELPLTMVYSEETSLEISPLNISKASGLQRLCKHLNLSIDKTIAVGDSDNDLEVLKTAGLSIAMKNAKDYVKDICDVIVADNNHDGCAEAIHRYLLKKNL